MAQPEQEVQFLLNLQRLLSEGEFVSTYKYALLQALADLAVELGKDTDEEQPIAITSIAEKFVQYYWRQTLPYVPPENTQNAGVLRQNTGRPAEVISLLQASRQEYASLNALKAKNPKKWVALLKRVDRVVRKMPLWKLQRVGPEYLSFLYEDRQDGNIIVLKPGVVFCLRKFHWLIGDMVRGAWLRYVRRFNANILGSATDLQEFLFGSERESLAALVPILREVQKDVCLYCGREIKAELAHVDHFIPWSRYPVDLGHNFVLAHARPCNSRKSDRLASSQHLATWLERNERHGSAMAGEFEDRRINFDLPVTLKIAKWAYTQLDQSAGLTWQANEELVPLTEGWEQMFIRV